MLSRTSEPKYLSDHVFDGVLFVGDPHQTSRTPTNRIDSLVFKFVCTKKLAQAVAIANEENLLMVILGDLFDREDDYEALMMVSNVLSMYHHRAVVLGGNHDKKTDILAVEETSSFRNLASEEANTDSFINFLSGLTDAEDYNDAKVYSDISKKQSRSAIYLLRSARIINLVDTTSYIGSIKTVEGIDYNLFGCPYGEQIPTSLNCALDGRNFLFTHHDLDFGVGLVFPDSDKLYPIEDCYMAVNGHIHDFKKILRVGDTLWFNPGNILRLSKDMAGHIPSVFSFTEADAQSNMDDTDCSKVKRFTIKHNQNVFRTNEALDRIERETRSEHKESRHSNNFVRRLKLMLASEPDVSEGDEKIKNLISNLPTSVEKSVLEKLHQRVVSSRK
ncbi:metallophosphoesterase [Aeromonas caviae]|jgi:hypothetical protein|uniref:metallophosphoesterase n=1 Tax=Aeromonas caviae TaxID=648 RepID=UPI00385B58BB